MNLLKSRAEGPVAQQLHSFIWSFVHAFTQQILCEALCKEGSLASVLLFCSLVEKLDNEPQLETHYQGEGCYGWVYDLISGGFRHTLVGKSPGSGAPAGVKS